jgi:hypothetical protein
LPKKRPTGYNKNNRQRHSADCYYAVKKRG